MMNAETDKDELDRVKALLRGFIKKFDEYSCIKNDKWYLEYRASVLEELDKVDE